MIKIENVTTYGWGESIRGMRNPMNSWDKSDTYKNYSVSYDEEGGETHTSYWRIGAGDLNLAEKLAKAGGSDAKFRRMIVVYMDITAPLYFWKEFDTYKVGTVRNSCSTMHKLHTRDLVTLEDFSCEHLYPDELSHLDETIKIINADRKLYLDNEKEYKRDWWQLIQLLPSCYNQRSTVMLNYEVLAHMYKDRHNHKLDEWRDFCIAIKQLPYAKELIVCEG